MSDLAETLAAIDAATGCQQCEGPLGGSPSADFCSQSCQEAWYSNRSELLVGYREPVDLAVHYTNLEEFDSFGTTSDWVIRDEVSVFINFDPGPLVRTMSEFQRALNETLLRLSWALPNPGRPAQPLGVLGVLNESWLESAMEPHEPIESVEPAGVDYEFDFPSTPLLADEPEAPRVRETVWDLEALQRLADRQPGGYTTTLRPATERRRPVRSLR